MSPNKKRAWFFNWFVIKKGSDTSGNWAHRGDPPNRGGSIPGGGHSSIGITSGMTADEVKEQTGKRRSEMKKKPQEMTANTAEGVRTRLIADLGDLSDSLDAERKRRDILQNKYSEYGGIAREGSYAMIKLGESQKDTSEYKALKAKSEEYSKKQSEVWNTITKSNERIQEMEVELREKGMPYVEVPKGQQTNVILDIDGLKTSQHESAQAGVGLFNRLCGVGYANDEEVVVKSSSAQRSFFQYGEVSLSKGAGPKSALHELGHWLEDHDIDVAVKAREFLARRTSGEKAVSLKSLTGENYGKEEVTKADQFMSPYMGKQYNYATEIISMGMEMLFANPVNFARKDPDYFDFMWALLRDKG